MESKYLEKFKKIEEQYGDKHELIGDCIYVEEIPEKNAVTKSGIEIVSVTGRAKSGLTDSRPKFVLVLAVGAGFYDGDTGKDIPLGVNPGDIIIVSSLSVDWFNIFGNHVCEEGHRIGLTRESEIKHRFKGADSYAKILGLLGDDAEPGQTKAV